MTLKSILQLLCVLTFSSVCLDAAAEDAAPVAELAAADGAPTAFACIAADRPDVTTLQAGCDTIGGAAAKTQSNPDRASKITGAPSQFVLVRMTSSEAIVDPVKDGRVEKVTVSAGDVTISRNAGDALNGDKKTIEVPLADLKPLANGAKVTVRIDYVAPDGAARRASDTSYFTLNNRFSPYGLAGTAAYVWVPLGLFATNLHATNEGIPLGTFPVGVAVGARFFVSGPFYIGASIMANYAIYPSTDEQQTAGSTKSDVNLKSGALGLLADVNGYGYIGAAYLKEFAKDGKDPGFMVVVGPGPKFLTFLQAPGK